MGRQLFRQVDNHTLERYTKKAIPRRRKSSLAKSKRMVILKRALQALPPRELQMLYLVKVKRVEQEEARRLYDVRQSNISYRLDRAQNRIKLHDKIAHLVSETQLRRKLIQYGLPENTVKAVAGVVRTTSQTAAAEALKISQGSVRHMFSQAIKLLEDKEPDCQELVLLKLIERNYNQLRAISSQERWRWKKHSGGGDTPNQKS